MLRDDQALAERFMLPEISQILNPEWPSYPMACSIQPTTASVAVIPPRFGRSPGAPGCQSCSRHPLNNDSVPFRRSINLWPPTRTVNFSFGHERQLRRTNGGGTPNRWMRSKIAANNSRGELLGFHCGRHLW